MKTSCALFLCLAAGVSVGQQPRRTRVNPVIMDDTLPSVYARFERAGKRPPVRAGESDAGVWFRIHNNTRQAISLCTESLYIGQKVKPLRLATGKDVLALRDGIEVSPCYTVEEQVTSSAEPGSKQGGLVADALGPYQHRPLGAAGHTSSTSWLPSGSSVTVSFPREQLAMGMRIGVPFNYEWEPQSRQVLHTVFILPTDLPSR